jgi:DNA-binding CsgD family transcriptional regulator
MLPKLKRLNRQNLQLLQSSLVDLYRDVSQSTLTPRTLRFAEKIIAADIARFDFWDSKGAIKMQGWGNATIQPTEKQLEVFGRYAHENPVFIEAVVKKRLDPILLSDFMSVEDFIQTSVYKEFYRHIQAKYQMAITLWVSSDLLITCIFCKSQQDFSESDRLMLSLAAPHLINAVRNASDFDHLASALEVKNSGVLAIDAGGKIQYVSEFVLQIWSKYFANNLTNGDLLPEMLMNWVKRNELSKPNPTAAIQPFEMKNKYGELNVRFIMNDQQLGKTLLFEEKRTISAKTLEILALTRREAEVLFWMSQGKTDKEIAGLCKISHHTVHKHAQNIYIKLGVENRTAAMMKAFEVL